MLDTDLPTQEWLIPILREELALIGLQIQEMQQAAVITRDAESALEYIHALRTLRLYYTDAQQRLAEQYA